MTPVVPFMVSPGGRPDAEKDVGVFVPVTLNVSGEPAVPVTAEGELTTGTFDEFAK